jgi:hypothetical protein
VTWPFRRQGGPEQGADIRNFEEALHAG